MSVKFGVQGAGQYPEGMPDASFFREVARLAEDLGYDSLWAGEHISFENPILEAFVALSFFTGCTSRITLGTGIVLLPLRHPSLIAKQVASLDVLADGRLIFGVGVGGEGDKDFEALEVPKAERGSRTDESLDAIRALWSQANASFHGKHYNIDGVTIDPRPSQPDRPPIWIGGRSERALRRVAHKGNGWLAAFSSPEGYARGLATLETEAERAGRAAEDLVKAHMIHTVVDPDPRHARAQAKQHMSSRYGRPFEDHVIERYCLAGDPQECSERAQRYLDVGVEHLVFVPVVPPARFPAQMETIWSEVVEPLRGRSGR